MCIYVRTVQTPQMGTQWVLHTAPVRGQLDPKRVAGSPTLSTVNMHEEMGQLQVPRHPLPGICNGTALSS
jgi:hypothetical protein